ncbi:MAG TPA: GTPase [Candidatus Limnocylindrales bacterium]|nr:GTPase [Candidatus Limnocylindrales bacterium]
MSTSSPRSRLPRAPRTRHAPDTGESGREAADSAPASLPALVDRLEELARRRLALHPVSDVAVARAERLRDHLAGHLRVRSRSLDAPLLVLLLGPTGAGKSTLFNTLVGRAASPTGVLRPTTREAVVLVQPADREALLEGTLAAVERDRIRIIEDASIERGLALVDAPDVDSVEHANRELTDRLVEAADLCLFVTTATRYADRVPWAVLERVRERGLPLIVVVNRMPPDSADASEVTADVVRLLSTTGLHVVARDAGDQASRGAPIDDVPLLAVAEGDVDPGTESLRAAAVAPILDRVAALRADRDERRAIAARALTGALAGLGPLLDAVADDCEHEAIDADALRRTAATRFESELVALRDALGHGTFLREEAVRQWHDYVGADEVTRLFSTGIGRVRGAIASVFRPTEPPVEPVRKATADDLIGLARLHAAEAARRTAMAWADDPVVAAAVADDPTLWSVSRGFDDRLRVRIEAWMASIAEEVRTTGRPKRQLAKGASVGVNALGTGVMLATFVHTGGLTGAELGVAAGTAFLNQKLLSALFGEAAMVELIRHARENLDGILAATFAQERARFDSLVAGGEPLRALAADVRAAATDVRSLPPNLPDELRAVLVAPAEGAASPARSGA